MARDNPSNEAVPAKEMMVECRVCGKSRLVNVLGAELQVRCPDCGSEIQMPLPGDDDAGIPEAGPAADAAEEPTDARERLSPPSAQGDA